MPQFKLPDDFVDTANQRFREAERFWQNWRSEARDEYAFVAGDQWLPDDLSLLTEQKRPPITFNYSEKMIDAVVGAEVSARQEVTYRPREMSDVPLAELWTNASKWCRDEGNYEDEETDAFRDCLICGMGWTHMYMSYEVDPDGLIMKDRVDPLDMRSDPSAMKPGLVDRRYQFRAWWVDEKVARRQWPDAFIIGGDANPGEAPGIDTIVRGQRYSTDSENLDDDPDMHRGQVLIRHYECVELEPFYRISTGNSIMEASAADFKGMKADLDSRGITYVKQVRRVYYYGYFADETLLEAGKSPTQEGFTYSCITGKRDRNRNYWYGLTRVMKDPQRWANKWLSQILHIINSNAKGGLLAEVNAFVDPEKAQEDWAAPDSIVFLREGALSGSKVKEKQMASYPTGLDRLMEFALSSLPQVTGINLEALGLAGREQANVLEQSRKQAAYGLLAPIFDSLRRYRKVDGRVLLDFIHNYISDGRLIRIGGPESQQFVPLTKAPNAPRYDIIVDQSPTAPDVKQKTWQVLESILPAMMKAGVPVPPDVVDYTPIPTALAIKWKQFIASNTTNPQQVEQLKQQLGDLTQQNQQLQVKLQDKSAEIQMKAIQTKQDMALKQQEHDARMQNMMQEHQHSMELTRAKNEADIENQLVATLHSGLNTANSDVMDAINKLIQTVGQLENDAQANDTTSE